MVGVSEDIEDTVDHRCVDGLRPTRHTEAGQSDSPDVRVASKARTRSPYSLPRPQAHTRTIGLRTGVPVKL